LKKREQAADEKLAIVMKDPKEKNSRKDQLFLSKIKAYVSMVKRLLMSDGLRGEM